MYENMSVLPLPGTLSLYFPSASVMAPVVVPFKITFTPGRAEPSSWAVILPLTVRVCAHSGPVASMASRQAESRFLIMVLFGLIVERETHCLPR